MPLHGDIHNVIYFLYFASHVLCFEYIGGSHYTIKIVSDMKCSNDSAGERWRCSFFS